ncbi:MAG: YciI family protein [Chloroflexota bacterium]
MRFMVIVKEDQDSEAGKLPPPELFEAMGKFNEDLVKAGVMLSAEGLLPSSKGFRMKYEGEKRTIIDGPFAEAKELVGGFWILQVKSRDEVIEWMKRAPFDGGVEIEVRQIGELEDYGDAVPDSVKEQERRLRSEIEGQQK